jgi:sec-independent protein translocase protein TatA
MNALKPWHFLVLAVVFLVLFGSKRLPDSARSLGRSLRIFKSEVQEMNKDDSKEDKKSDPSSDK